VRPKRVLVKLSGEALAGQAGSGLDGHTLTALAADIAHAAREGVEIAIVVGGGNFFRGLQGLNKGLDRPSADSIGMLGTVMNFRVSPNRGNALPPCFIAFSSREPVSTSLENALDNVLVRSIASTSKTVS
jgi:hypothetical protein